VELVSWNDTLVRVNEKQRFCSGFKYSSGFKDHIHRLGNVYERHYRYVTPSHFVDQSQSLNLFMQNANYSKLTSMHFYALQSGLKQECTIYEQKQQLMLKFTLNNDKREPIEVQSKPLWFQ
jgi:hypothetical protein